MKPLKSIVVEFNFEDGTSIAHRRFVGENLDLYDMRDEIIRLTNRGKTISNYYNIPCFQCKFYSDRTKTCHSTGPGVYNCDLFREWRCGRCNFNRECDTCSFGKQLDIENHNDGC
jgi:hypothetical protein